MCDNASDMLLADKLQRALICNVASGVG